RQLAARPEVCPPSPLPCWQAAGAVGFSARDFAKLRSAPPPPGGAWSCLAICASTTWPRESPAVPAPTAAKPDLEHRHHLGRRRRRAGDDEMLAGIRGMITGSAESSAGCQGFDGLLAIGATTGTGPAARQPPPCYRCGVLAKYARSVGSAAEGAVADRFALLTALGRRSASRSEERRVGKECRSEGPHHHNERNWSTNGWSSRWN